MIYRKITIFVSFFVPIIITLTGVLLLKSISYKRYVALVTNPKVVEALNTKSSYDLQLAIQQMNLDYKYIQKDKVVVQSSANLPEVSLISFETKTITGVIEPKIEELLPKLLPYVALENQQMYLVSVLSARLDSEDYYLVYSPLL